MEICCKKCGETIGFVSNDDFIILFKKQTQEYFCFGCAPFYHPCNNCEFFRENLWSSNICSKTSDNSFYQICIKKEIKQ